MTPLLRQFTCKVFWRCGGLSGVLLLSRNVWHIREASPRCRGSCVIIFLFVVVALIGLLWHALAKPDFLWIAAEPLYFKEFENEDLMIKVVFFSVRIDYEIVWEGNHKFAPESTQDLFDYVLKGTWSILQSEWHDSELVLDFIWCG